MRPGIQYVRNSTADWLAGPMFVLSLLFLLLVAALTVVWVDIPQAEFVLGPDGLPGKDSGTDTLDFELASLQLGSHIAKLIFLFWLVFIGEFLFSYFSQRRHGRSFWQYDFYRLLVCFLPPLRMAAPVPNKGGRIWLPGFGWRMPGRALSKRLEKTFSKPMLLIATLILPVLIVEFGMQTYVQQHLWLRLILHISTGFIWIAFSVEFIIRFSATHRKFEYVKKNWIDLAIVALPLISFLRSLRVLRAVKLAKFAQVQHLARIGRIYRLRSLAVKVLRALILFEFFHRFFRIKPEKKLAALRAEFRERKADLTDLQKRIDQLAEEVRQSRSEEGGTPCTDDRGEKPTVDPDCKMS